MGKMDIPRFLPFHFHRIIPIPVPFKPLERHVSIKRREWSFPQSTAAMGRTCSLTFQGRQGQGGPNDRVAICFVSTPSAANIQNPYDISINHPDWFMTTSLECQIYNPYITG